MADDALTPAERATLQHRQHELTIGTRLHCLDTASKIGRLQAALTIPLDGEPDPVDQLIAAARRLEAYVLGQDGPTT